MSGQDNLNHGRFCDGLSRRDMLTAGGASLFGTTFSLSSILEGQARAAKPNSENSLIILFLAGGLSTIDTWDMKPDAPKEFRGTFDPIATSVPGVQLCEHLPRLAKQMDKFAVVRSFGHRNSGHGPADHYILTGYHPAAGFNAGLKPNNQRPAHGSIIARELGARGSVPPYVCVPSMHNSGGSSYLGSSAAPFVVESDPALPNFSVPDLAPPVAIDAARFGSRRDLLSTVDRFQKRGEAKFNSQVRTVSSFQQKAFELMTSPATKKAFDIHSESDKVRDRYGRNTLGQSCLMARRLVASGVRCVLINHANWDTHYNNFHVLKNDLLHLLDGGMSTLLEDLYDRGMLEKTMVLVTGEFGRTPRINKLAGRDHWGPSTAIAMAGGGIKGGTIVGASNARAEKPATKPYRPADLAATIYHSLGVNPGKIFISGDGRPFPIVPHGGEVIEELFA